MGQNRFQGKQSEITQYTVLMYYQDLLRAFPSSPEVAPVSEVTDSTLSKILLFICSTENKKNISAIYVYPNSIQT